MHFFLSWYANLAPREQLLIKFGGPLILLLLAYLLVSGGKPASSGVELTRSSKNSSKSTSLAKPSPAALNLAASFNQLAPSTQARLVKAKALNEDEVTGLARSAGFSQLSLTLTAGQLELTAKVNNPKQVENFLHQLARLGWQWHNLDLLQLDDLTTQVTLHLEAL